MLSTADQEPAPVVFIRQIHRRIALVFVCVGFLVIFSAGILYLASSYVISSNARQTGMLHLVDAWERLISTVREAEVRQRDFLLSGIEEDLNSFNGVAARVSPLVKSISAQESDAQVVGQFQELTEKRMAILRTAADLRRDEGFEAARALVRLGEGKAVMAQLEELAAKLREGRQQRVEEEMRKQDDSSRWLGAVFIVLGAANILVLRWCYRRIAKGMETEESALLKRYTFASPALQ